MLSLALLGPVRVALDGRPTRFRTSKVQALLIYLAVEAAARPASRHRREALMELFWPGLPPPSAQDNLRQVLYQLRKAIPDLPAGDGAARAPLLLADRRTVQLNPAAAYDLDVATFRQLLNGSPSPAALEQAAALYGGDFLADFYLPDSDSFESWAAQHRAALRREALDALEQLARLCIAQGDLDGAEAYIRRQLDIDNLRESAHRQLMAVLAQGDQRSQALRQYDLLVELLDKELGLPPEEETAALYRAIASQHAPAAKPRGEPPAPEPAAAEPHEELRWVSVLLAGVANFTALSERMGPEDLKVRSDHWTRRMCQEVLRFGGTVVSIRGDEVAAVFGAPMAHEDDAERAVRAGLAIAGLKLADGFGQAARLHVAVSSGEAIAGLSGPLDRRTYTVIGDAVNAVARLLPAVPPGGVWVEETTCRSTRHAVRYRPAPPGASARLPVWEALDVAAPPHRRPFGTAPFIGRDQELELLLTMWQRVADARQPHLVTILGEAGIGKSRFVAEFERRLPTSAVVLHGSCLPYGTALSYGALEAMLKEAAGVLAEDDAAAARAKLDALVTRVMAPRPDASVTAPYEQIARHLALVTGLDVEADRPSISRDERAFRVSVHRFLTGLACEGPLCLIFDNLQWADSTLLDLIDYIASHAHEVPLLIVAQSRPEFIERRPTWGGRAQSSSLMHLQPLDPSAEQALLQALWRERGLPDQLAAQVRSAGGNPLYAEELVAMVAEQGEGAGVPLAISMLIAARLDTLPPEERRTLQVAAVLGSVCWEGAVCALAGRDAAEQLEGLAQKGLLRLQARSHYPGEYEYAFKHDLIRDVAYEMLPRAERRALHGQAADWLERAAGEHVVSSHDLIAHHAIEADQHERALTSLIHAAEQAGRASARRREAELLAEAIALAQRLSRHTLVADLQARRGRAFVDLGMWSEAARELEAALTGLAATEIEQRVQVLADLAWTKFWMVDVTGQSSAARQAMALAERVDRDDLRAKALFAVGFSHLNTPELQATQDLCRQALSHAEDTPSRERAMASWASGLVSLWRGNFDEAIHYHRQAIRMGSDQHDTVPMMTALPQLGLALAGSGRYGEAEGVFRQVRQYGQMYEYWPFLARAMSMEAGFHLDLFDYAGHEQIAMEARDLGLSIRFAPPTLSSSIDLLLNFARRHEIGRCESLVAEVAEAVETAAGVHGWLWRLRLSEALAEIALARGDWEAALSHAELGIARSRAFGRAKYHALSLDSRARALAGLGRTREAIADLQGAVAVARSIGDPAVFLRVAASLLSVAGDDTLLAETQAAAQRIRAAMPGAEMRALFDAAEPVQMLSRHGGSPRLHQ